MKTGWTGLECMARLCPPTHFYRQGFRVPMNISVKLAASIFILLSGCAGRTLDDIIHGRDPIQEAIKANTLKTQQLNAILDTWKGRSGDELISTWGPPTLITPLQNGGRVLTYSTSSTVTFPGAATTTIVPTFGTGSIGFNGGLPQTYNQSGLALAPSISPPTTYNFHCQKNMTVDKSNIILTWSYTGNRCF